MAHVRRISPDRAVGRDGPAGALRRRAWTIWPIAPAWRSVRPCESDPIGGVIETASSLGSVLVDMTGRTRRIRADGPAWRAGLDGCFAAAASAVVHPVQLWRRRRAPAERSGGNGRSVTGGGSQGPFDGTGPGSGARVRAGDAVSGHPARPLGPAAADRPDAVGARRRACRGRAAVRPVRDRGPDGLAAGRADILRLFRAVAPKTHRTVARRRSGVSGRFALGPSRARGGADAERHGGATWEDLP